MPTLSNVSENMSQEPFPSTRIMCCLTCNATQKPDDVFQTHGLGTLVKLKPDEAFVAIKKAY